MKASQKFTIDSIDWNSLVLRLTKAAVRFVNKKEDFVVCGVGSSIEDYVIEAVTTLFDKFDTYDLRSEDECFAMAKTIMERDYLDSIKSSSHKTTEIYDSEDKTKQFGELPSKTNGFEKLEKDLLARKYYEFANEERDLKDVIDSVVYFDELEPRNIGNLIGVTAQEVNNRKKRLQYNRDKKK
jgi:DNA-directed RNA polymerase specialized sigma24 family protein